MPHHPQASHHVRHTCLLLLITCSGTPAGPNELITVQAGQVVMGKPETFPSYGWDNEYGQVTVKYEMHVLCIIKTCACSVPEFEASKYLVTNKEFLQFVEDGGYQRKELWTKEGVINCLNY